MLDVVRGVPGFLSMALEMGSEMVWVLKCCSGCNHHVVIVDFGSAPPRPAWCVTVGRAGRLAYYAPCMHADLYRSTVQDLEHAHCTRIADR